MKNNKRFDISSRLIHFFRKVDVSSDNGISAPENWGPGEIVEDPIVSPMFLLRNAVRLGRIWATWSERGGRRTIFGPHPAVCFTEMPLAAFIEAGVDRQRRGQAMSPYGLMFSKAAMFRLRARPVIYGLSSSPRIPRGAGGGERVIPTAALPLDEQYRYVAYVPGRIDWTHEREWRWKCTEARPEKKLDLASLVGLGLSDIDLEEAAQAKLPLDGHEIPGLDLNNAPLVGLGAIVKTNEQAERLIHDVLTIADRAGDQGSNYEFVLSLERLKNIGQLRDPRQADEAVRAAAFDLDPFFSQKEDEVLNHLRDFHKAVQEATTAPAKTPYRETGGCWLWLTDARHPMVRALVKKGLVAVNRDGRYLVQIDEFNSGLPLGAREGMTRRLAELLSERHGVGATYHSVLGKNDPDEVPHYSDPPFSNCFHFNYGSEAGDF